MCVSVCESVRVFRCVPCILIPDLGHAWFVLPLLLLHLLLLLVVLLLLLLLLMHLLLSLLKVFLLFFISIHFIFSHICTQCSMRSLIYSMHAAAAPALNLSLTLSRLHSY